MFCAALLPEQSLHASVRLLTRFEAPAARMNVFHLQRIADTTDVRILQQLHVDAHQFLSQVRDRCHAA